MAKKYSMFPSAPSVSAADSVVGLHDGENSRFSFATILSFIQSLFVPTSRKVNNKSLSTDITLDASDVGAVDTADVGVADGVASLDSTGKVPSSQLPPISSDAEDITYDPTASGLTATNVQDALDEAFDDLDGKQSTITASGILKGDGAGGVSAATPGTDYQAPLTIDSTPTENSTNPVQSGGVYDALGTKLSKAAVSLGSFNDLNDIVEPGWYKCTTTPANAPSGNFQNAWFEVVANDSNILQFAYSNPASSTGPTPKVRIRLNGVWGDWVSFDENYPYANQSQLAYIENGTTASRPYSAGEYFCWNGLLYRAKTAISQGAAFTINTNCEQVPEGGLNALKAQTLVRRQTLATSITTGLNEWDVAADAVSGYKPIGIVGVQFAALPRSAVTLSQFLLDGTNVVVAAQSTQARTSGIAVNAFVLYAKE